MDSSSIGSLVFDAAMPTGAVMISWGCSDTIRYVCRWVQARKVWSALEHQQASARISQRFAPPPPQQGCTHNMPFHKCRSGRSVSGSGGPSWRCRRRQASIRAPSPSSGASCSQSWTVVATQRCCTSSGARVCRASGRSMRAYQSNAPTGCRGPRQSRAGHMMAHHTPAIRRSLSAQEGKRRPLPGTVMTFHAGVDARTITCYLLRTSISVQEAGRCAQPAVRRSGGVGGHGEPAAVADPAIAAAASVLCAPQPGTPLAQPEGIRLYGPVEGVRGPTGMFSAVVSGRAC